jgi:hypothetical protein
MENIFLSKLPMYEYYTSIGYTEQDINDDAVMTIQNRILGMSDAERAELGISDDFLQTNNIYDMLNDGRVKFTYDTRSNKPFPKYHIGIDFDMNGVHVNLPNPFSTEVGFQPMKLNDNMKNFQYDNFKVDYLNNKYNSAKATLSVGTQTFLKENPTLDGIIRTFFNGYMNIGASMDYIGDQVIQEINESDIFPFNLMTTSDSKDRYSMLLQTALREQVMINQMSSELTKNYPLLMELEEELKTGEYMMLKGNSLFHHITTNEGGFYNRVYSTAPSFKLMNEIEKVDFLQQKNEDGTYKNDPTIGYGFSLNTKYIKDRLVERGYNIDNLIARKESITEKDAIEIFYQYANNEFTALRNDFPELAEDKNTLLAVALLDTVFLSGYGSKSFIGNRAKKAIRKYLNADNEADKLAALGEFKAYAYEDVQRNIVSSGKGYNVATQESSKPLHVGYKISTQGYTSEPTLLQEFYNDGLYSKEERGYGGHFERLRKNSELIKAHASGVSEVNPIKYIPTA